MMIGPMEANEAGIRAAVDATVDAGTVSFETQIESESGGMIRLRRHGVCDFTHWREAAHTVTELPADVPDAYQITDGGIVYTQETGDEWSALDMGGWAAASLMSELAWLYGVVDVRPGDGGDHGVTMSAERALEVCPAPLRDELRTSFQQAGHLDAVGTGRVRTDASNRIVECRLELPASVNGLFGSVDVSSRITVALSDFGVPAQIRPPDAGHAQPIEDFVGSFLRRAEEGE
jgi:hypothetical protein